MIDSLPQLLALLNSSEKRTVKKGLDILGQHARALLRKNKTEETNENDVNFDDENEESSKPSHVIPSLASNLAIAYLNSSPQCFELIRLLDEEPEEETALVLAILRTMRDLLHSYPVLKNCGPVLSLGGKLLKGRSRRLIAGLASGKHALCVAVLQVMEGIVRLGRNQVRDLVKTIDFGSSHMLAWLRDPREKRMNKQELQRMAKEDDNLTWYRGKDSRRAAIELLIAVVECADASVVQSVMDLKGYVLAAPFRHLLSDPPYLAIKYIRTLYFKASNNPRISRNSKTQLFNGYNLSSIIRLYKTDNEAIRKAVHDLLMSVISTKGILTNFGTMSLGLRVSSGAPFTDILQPNILQPEADAMQQRLLLRILKFRPDLQVTYIRTLGSASIPPKLSLRYLAHLNFVSSLLSLALPRTLLSPPPPTWFKVADGQVDYDSHLLMFTQTVALLTDYIAPPVVCSGSLFTQALRFPNALVRISILTMFTRLLHRYLNVQRFCRNQEKSSSLGEGCDPSDYINGWNLLMASVTRKVKSRLPDIQALLAMRTLKLNEGSTEPPPAAAAAAMSPQAASLLSARVYHVISLYLQCFPELHSELRLDVAKMFSEEYALATKKSENDDAMVDVDDDDDNRRSAHGSSASLLHVLRIALNSESSGSCSKWTAGSMLPFKQLLQTASGMLMAHEIQVVARRVVCKIMIELGAMGQAAALQMDVDPYSVAPNAMREARIWTDAIYPAAIPSFSKVVSSLEKEMLALTEKAATLTEKLQGQHEGSEGFVVTPLMVATLNALMAAEDGSNVEALGIILGTVFQRLIYSGFTDKSVLVSLISLAGLKDNGLMQQVVGSNAGKKKKKSKSSLDVPHCLKVLEKQGEAHQEAKLQLLLELSPSTLSEVIVHYCNGGNMVTLHDLMLPILWVRSDFDCHGKDTAKILMHLPFDLAVVYLQRLGADAFNDAQNIEILARLSDSLDKAELRAAMEYILHAIDVVKEASASSIKETRTITSMLHIATQLALRPLHQTKEEEDEDEENAAEEEHVEDNQQQQQQQQHGQDTETNQQQQQQGTGEGDEKSQQQQQQQHHHQQQQHVKHEPLDSYAESNAIVLFQILVGHVQISTSIQNPLSPVDCGVGFAIVDALRSLLHALPRGSAEFTSSGRRIVDSCLSLLQTAIENAVKSLSSSKSEEVALTSLQHSAALFRALIHVCPPRVLSSVMATLMGFISTLGESKKSSTKILSSTSAVLLQIIRCASKSRDDGAQAGGLQLGMAQLQQLFGLALRLKDDHNIITLLHEVFAANLSIPASRPLGSGYHADLSLLAEDPNAHKMVVETVRLCFRRGSAASASASASPSSLVFVNPACLLVHSSTTLRQHVAPVFTELLTAMLSSASASSDSFEIKHEYCSMFSVESLLLLKNYLKGLMLDAQAGVSGSYETLHTLVPLLRIPLLSLCCCCEEHKNNKSGRIELQREASLCLISLLSRKDLGLWGVGFIRDMASYIGEREWFWHSMVVDVLQAAAGSLLAGEKEDDHEWTQGCLAAALMRSLTCLYRLRGEANQQQQQQPHTSKESKLMLEKMLLRTIEAVWSRPLSLFMEGLTHCDGKSVFSKYTRRCLQQQYTDAASMATLHGFVRLLLRHLELHSEDSESHDVLRVVKLHQMLIGHSSFLQVLCSKAAVPQPPKLEICLWGDDDAEAGLAKRKQNIHTARYHVLGLLLDLTAANPGKLVEGNLVRSLLMGYHATLHPEDRLIWQILEIYASNGQSPEAYHFKFGAAVLQRTTSQWSPYMWVWEKNGLNQKRLQATSTRLPLTANISEHLPAPPMEQDIFAVLDRYVGIAKPSGKEIPEWAWGCYDPSMVLQILARSFASADNRAPHRALESGAMAVAFHCMSSQSLHIRKLAYGAVESFSFAAETNTSSLGLADAGPLRLLLRILRESIDEPFKQLPAVITSFVNCAIQIVTRPSEVLYQPVCRFLLKQSAFNLDAVPMLNLLQSDSQTHREARHWVLRYLRFGPRITQDIAIFRRQRVFESLISIHDSLVAHATFRAGVLQAILGACRTPFGAIHLVKVQGIWSWLSILVSGLGSGRRGPTSAAATGSTVRDDGYGEVIAVHAATSIGLRLIKALAKSDSERDSLHEMWSFVSTVYEIRKHWAKGAVSTESNFRTYEALRLLLLAMKATHGYPSHFMPVSPVSIGTIVKLSYNVDERVAKYPNSEISLGLRRTMASIIAALPVQWIVHAKTVPVDLPMKWNRLASWAISECCPDISSSTFATAHAASYWKPSNPFGASKSIGVLLWIASSLSESVTLRKMLLSTSSENESVFAAAGTTVTKNKTTTTTTTASSTKSNMTTQQQQQLFSSLLVSRLLFLYRRLGIDEVSLASPLGVMLIRSLNSVFLPLLFQAFADGRSGAAEGDDISKVLKQGSWPTIMQYCVGALCEHLPHPSSAATVGNQVQQWCDYILGIVIRHVWAGDCDGQVVVDALKASVAKSSHEEEISSIARSILKRMDQKDEDGDKKHGKSQSSKKKK